MNNLKKIFSSQEYGWIHYGIHCIKMLDATLHQNNNSKHVELDTFFCNYSLDIY